ncbi:protein-L-isoaspartate(D-aspartate) O-methyltransferase [Bellilinea caldifistulae]|uniref:Protein-L-isoaspartate O-methyltransferase n=1 Tax=Bellilinea caldifistulae TaxID=360411 RepID=A0A0P6XML5_9CHLR|nr:protein-L-isoaspartate(D-aspartate) O-methyltransferase [Bellilinea caldifistulae]KPL77638.1 protein-L-isoaspartate O-methyltransferase [Bellilinea caldifistulae]
MNGETEYSKAREMMVREQIERRGLRSPRLLAAFRKVPRHLFVPPDLRERAYDDGPLPIGKGQTISQPYIVALMTSLLALEGNERVLEIGTGSGYQAAILGELAREVHTVERHAGLALRAAEVLSQLGYVNVHVHTGDGSLGWPESAPYDGIVVTAAAAAPPPPLLDQLAEGGRLVLPVGHRLEQVLQVWHKQGGQLTYENIIPVSFVPLRGQYGWSESEWERYEADDWL